MPMREFEGTFIKIKKPTVLQEPFEPPIRPSLYESCCFYCSEENVEFDKELYKRVGDEIKIILGEKEKYSVHDIVKYFQIKYLAYRVPYEHACWYIDISIFSKYEPYVYTPESEFDYDITSGEENITLVVDTIHNKALREKYPKIEQYEKGYLEREKNRLKEYERELSKRKKVGEQTAEFEVIIERFRKRIAHGEMGHNNPIIVIGYFEENIVNSMCIINQSPIAIDDIHYEMYYFYKHS